MSLHQRGLDAEGKGLDDRSGGALGRGAICEQLCGPFAATLKARVRGGRDFVSPRYERLGRAAKRAQGIEANHVCATLPDAVKRRFAIQTRERPILHVAVASTAFYRFQRERC